MCKAYATGSWASLDLERRILGHHEKVGPSDASWPVPRITLHLFERLLLALHGLPMVFPFEWPVVQPLRPRVDSQTWRPFSMTVRFFLYLPHAQTLHGTVIFYQHWGGLRDQWGGFFGAVPWSVWDRVQVPPEKVIISKEWS